MAEIPHAKPPSETVGGLKPTSFHESSTLAMGVPARLVYVGVAIAALWLCVWWALQ
jgi:hypothetical protein